MPTQRLQQSGHSGHHATFPFTAIVGQEEMKRCLLLNVIDPRIGGVMVMGHRGTGKSTTVRALADVLPEIRRVAGDAYNRETTDDERRTTAESVVGRPSSVVSASKQTQPPKFEKIAVPVVDLPLGATEDRVCGTIDIEAALTRGEKRFAPGLLAQANRGFLYIDEVNLLDDHLVDVLLDVAASGWNVVEREGISIRHPARFVLVGSGNPEEGELRPQLLDRFGLHARITTITQVQERVEIVKRRRAFDEDPAAFVQAWEPQQQQLRKRIIHAQKMLPEVVLPDEVLLRVAELCMKLGIDGHRGELTVTRAACAYAAFQSKATHGPHGFIAVTYDDVKVMAVAALRHRLRRDPLEIVDSDERIARAL